MASLAIFPAYLIWHYTTAYTDIFRLWVNYVWFFYNFFSIPLLAKTLFAPWQRISERRRGGFSLEDVAEVIMVNTIMRLVGFIVRIIFIVIGSILVLSVFFGGALLVLIWTVFPVLAIVSIFYGLDTLIS
jgi:hypothetical protein